MVKIMNKNTLSAGIKFVSLTLSAVLVFQSSAPVYAQSKNLKYSISDSEKKLDQRLNAVAPADNTRVAQRPYIMPKQYKDKAWIEADKIKFELLYGSQMPSSQPQNDQGSLGPVSYKKFYSDFSKELDKQVAEYKKENEKQKKDRLLEIDVKAGEYLLSGEYNEEEVEAWKEEETKRLDQWLVSAQKDLDEVKSAELNKARARYDEYKAELKADTNVYEKEVFYEVQKKIRKLFSLYNKNPNSGIGPILLETVPFFIPMRYNGNKMLNAEQEKIIYDLALAQLEKPITAKTGNINPYISAITVFANLGKRGDGGSYIVRDMLYSSVNAPQLHPQLLFTSVSALLAMKDYAAIKDILRYFNQRESVFETVDVLSIANWVDYIQTMNGKYLGKMSSLAQYQLENGSMANAYTDIALMLAEEGSAEALQILKTFGVDQCAMTIKPGIKTKFSPTCAGIKPFVVGALISGKAGAENYSGPFVSKRVGEQEFNSSGRIKVYTAQDVSRIQNTISNNLQRFKTTVKASGMSPNAYMAFNLINEPMGDINGGQEYAMDSAMLERYKKEISRSNLGSGAIIDKARMSRKANKQNIYRYARITGSLLDIAILAWCAVDLVRLAGGLYSLGRGSYSAFRLARAGSQSQRISYITKHLPHLRKYSSAAKTMGRLSAKVKSSMEPIVLSAHRRLYSSVELPRIMNTSNAGTAVAEALASASFDSAKGGYVINAAEAYKASANKPGRVLDIANTKKILDEAALSAQTKFSNRGFFQKYKGYRGYLSNETKEGFLLSPLDRTSRDIGIDFAQNIRSSRDLTLGASSGSRDIEYFARPLGKPVENGVLELYHRDFNALYAEPLPVNISIEKKIPGIKSQNVERVLLTSNYQSKLNSKKNIDVMLSISLRGKKQNAALVDPAFFKIGIENDSFADIARISLTDSSPLKIKFIGEPQGFAAKLNNGIKNFIGGKQSLFSGTGKVFVREGSALRESSISLSTQRPFDGIQLIVNEDNTLSLLGRTKSGFMKELDANFSLALPKEELKNFTKYAAKGNFNTPFKLSLTGARNKINTLYLVQFLSLSAASTSLVGPLRDSYPDISNTAVALVSVVLPYASSILSPFWAPFVKRYGSANMLKASLGLAAVSLTAPIFSGFHGFGDVNKYNPNNPSILPLLISGTLIGLSSSITRASFDTLMDQMGGGGALLKSMTFKNLSSFAMLAPSLLATGVASLAQPRYYTDSAGNYILDESGNKISHPYVDPFFYNPFLLGTTALVFARFQSARIPTHIGKTDEVYRMSQFAKGLPGKSIFVKGFNKIYQPVAGILIETWNATKVLGNKAVLPVVLSSTAALGVESSLLYNYSQTEANRYMADYIPNNAVKATVATLLLAAAPALVRGFSPSITKFFGGENNPLTYNRILGASMLSAGAGAALLATEDNMPMFLTGMALAGIGFANTTKSFFKLGKYNLIKNKIPKSVVRGFEVAYPGVHIGMAVFPWLYSEAADMQVETQGSVDKQEALQDQIWIPAATLGAGSLFFLKGAGLLNFKLKAPAAGILGVSRFAIGSPSLMLRNWRSSPYYPDNKVGQMNIQTPSMELPEPNTPAEDTLEDDTSSAAAEIKK